MLNLCHPNNRVWGIYHILFLSAEKISERSRFVNNDDFDLMLLSSLSVNCINSQKFNIMYYKNKVVPNGVCIHNQFIDFRCILMIKCNCPFLKGAPCPDESTINVSQNQSKFIKYACLKRKTQENLSGFSDVTSFSSVF